MLERTLVSDLTEKEQDALLAQFGLQLGKYSADDLRTVINVQRDHFSGVIDAEVISQNGKIYDYRIFDPYNFVESIFTTSGWSDWCCAYVDKDGNSIDDILEQQF